VIRGEESVWLSRARVRVCDGTAGSRPHTAAPGAAPSTKENHMKFISSRTHTYIGAVVGVALIVAPWLFQFDEVEPAKWSAIGVGIFVLLNELVTTSPAALVKLVPMRVHVMLDVVTGIFLLATPFLFGFSDEDANAWVPHIVVGLLIAGYALVTDTSDSVQAAGTDGVDTARRNNR
jgi:hypothetical protein